MSATGSPDRRPLGAKETGTKGPGSLAHWAGPSKGPGGCPSSATQQTVRKAAANWGQNPGGAAFTPLRFLVDAQPRPAISKPVRMRV